MNHLIWINAKIFSDWSIIFTEKDWTNSSILLQCGRWDLNPHDCNNHKILSLARLPVPTLPHIFNCNMSCFFMRLIYNIRLSPRMQPLILFFNNYINPILFFHNYSHIILILNHIILILSPIILIHIDFYIFFC